MNNEVAQKILKEWREEGILTEFLNEHGEEARELSKQDGFDEGLQRGIYLTAQKMKKTGIDIARIIECTGLSEKEIEAL